jgi:tight adherence protein B
MDARTAVLLIAFVAAALIVEALYALWNARHGPEASRIARRLRLMASEDRGAEATSVLKVRHWENASPMDRFLMQLPGAPRVERLLLQAGSTLTLSRLLLRMAGFFIIGTLAGSVVSQLAAHGAGTRVGAILLGLIAAMVPPMLVVRAKYRRMNEFLLQLPEALDLVGRAMRAGHAFSGGLKMVADELRDPVGVEFRTAFEELNLGLSVENAMLNLMERVDLPDLRYFVVTVLIQRESGGNLAEILDNISRLIRERIRLLGRVRVLATQGRLEAWILSILPFVVAGVIFTIAPTMMSILWTEPAGRTMLATTAVMMLLGILIIWRIVHIRI